MTYHFYIGRGTSTIVIQLVFDVHSSLTDQVTLTSSYLIARMAHRTLDGSLLLADIARARARARRGKAIKARVRGAQEENRARNQADQYPGPSARRIGRAGRCRSRPDISSPLDRRFANNSAVARGAFFRWRLDTHRIYILLLLLGKRSSAERLFNTTRPLVLLAILRPWGPAPRGPCRRSPDKSRALSSLCLPFSLYLPPTALGRSSRRQKLKHRPGREWVAGIVNNRPAGEIVIDVHGAILSYPILAAGVRAISVRGNLLLKRVSTSATRPRPSASEPHKTARAR